MLFGLLSIEGALISIALFFDRIVYSLISTAYQVFILISKANLYNNVGDKIDKLTERIYVILGIAMLFVLAYNIILLIINPDGMSSKGDKSLSGIAKNFIISVVLLTLSPTLFSYMSTLQNNIIDSQVIENIILGGTGVSNPESSKAMGSSVATMIFSTFYHPQDADGNSLTYYDCLNDSSKSAICDEYTYAYDMATGGNLSVFMDNSKLENAITAKTPTMDYMPIISTIAGVVSLLMFINYVFDVGIRVAKLAFYQIIAPVPIIMRVTQPNGGMFSKWMKHLIDTYLQLFLRLITIYFSMFMIELVMNGLADVNGGIIPFSSDTSAIVKLLSYFMLIMGILLFAKEAPKMLEELIGGGFGGGGGFGLKSIGNKFKSAPLVGKGLARGASRLAGATTGALGAGLSALSNNWAARRDKTGEKGLTHMDTWAAMQQGMHHGAKRGGNQFGQQAGNVYSQTYGYGKKQGLFGGKSWQTQRDEKYDKIYSDNVKQHASDRNDQALNNNFDLPTNAPQIGDQVTNLNTMNQEFAGNSPYYREAADAIDQEAAAKGMVLSSDQRHQQIMQRLQNMAETTTDENKKRAIQSYLKSSEIVDAYNGSVLTGNATAVEAVKVQAEKETRTYVQQQIASNGGATGLVSDATVNATLQANATTAANAKITAAGGDLSKLELGDDVKSKLNTQVQTQVQAAITNAGGIGNISFSPTVESQIQANVDGNIRAQISAAGGSGNITLTSASQAKLDGMKVNFEANANNQIQAQVDAEFTPEVVSKMADEIKQNSVIAFATQAEEDAYVNKKIEEKKKSKFEEVKTAIFDKLMGEQESSARDQIVYEQMMDANGASEREKVVKEHLIKQTTTQVVTDYLVDQEYTKQVEDYLVNEQKAQVTDHLLEKASEEAVGAFASQIKDFDIGLMNGTYTEKANGEKSDKYSSEYVKNEEIASSGIKTKSAEDLAFDKIKKMLKEQDEKKDNK